MSLISSRCMCPSRVGASFVVTVPTAVPVRESVSSRASIRRDAEWNAVGIIDAGVVDLVAEVSSLLLLLLVLLLLSLLLTLTS